MLKVKHLHSDNFTLTKKVCLSLRVSLFHYGLALSVTFGDTSPKGRGSSCP